MSDEATLLSDESGAPASAGPFAPVEKLVEEMARGRMVILVDGPDRENEGDLVMAAELADAPSLNFMSKHGRGLICAPMALEFADRLELPLMTDEPSDPRECAFTISVDVRRGTTTGISAQDRARTALALADPRTRPADLNRPGHLFPLRARKGGVLERQGHTEAAVELTQWAGRRPVGLICEVMNDDGSMARLPQLIEFARREGLLLGSIADIVAASRERNPEMARAVESVRVRPMSSAPIPTPFGVFELFVFENAKKEELVALRMGAVEAAGKSGKPILTRIHSACFTGDILGSLRCDCGGQLQKALNVIGEEGLGLIIYLPQEGRGIGLAKKIEAYGLQQWGLDTVEANLELGFEADLRSYDDAAGILKWFGLDSVRLLTNNPAKIQGLEEHGISVAERVPLEPGAGPVNHAYLKTKKGKLGHLFEAV